QNLPKIVREKNVDGILMLGLADPKMASDIQERKIPVVIVDPYLSVKNINTIQIENKFGAQLAVEHLFNLGHRHIGMLTVSGVRPPSVHEREEGYEQALVKFGLSSKKDYVLESNTFSYQAAYEKAKLDLKRLKNMTALICVNDEMAAGAMRAAREVGRQVPQDLSVVGFDNIIMSAYTDPPLTTVSVAKEFLGKLGVDRLLEMVETKDLQTVKKELVPVELVVRESTAKPR
ncbi:MAG TPA: LacI family DNA-binding transcriptional regulator, partial [bacterium]